MTIGEMKDEQITRFIQTKLLRSVYLLTALFFLINVPKGNAQLQPPTFDYGKVKLWNNPKASFTYTNKLSKRVLFLPTQYQRDLYLRVPEGYIQPGQTVTIEAVYYTEEKGWFDISQQLFVSGSDQPIALNLRGKILSFHPDAQTACPLIEHKAIAVPKSSLATITVYDKSTGKVINGVDVMLIGTSKNYFVEHTKKLQLPLENIPIGLYQLDISKVGYAPVQHVQYIGANTGNLVFELEPLPNEVVSVVVPEGHGDDKLIEINKVEESDQSAIERIRQMMDERYKGRTIIEKDVMVLKDNTDTTVKEEVVHAEVPVVPLQDFDPTGKLNSAKYASNNVVFLIDVSGSMKIQNKLEEMKLAMKSLVNILREQDKVTIIIYSTKARILLTSTPGDQKEAIFAVIDGLRANGSSYGAEGLNMAYQFALENFIKRGNNQIILASDGLFNSPDITERDIYSMAQIHLIQGISTSVVGFGQKEEAKQFMMQLASSGGGNFIQISGEQEAQSALVAEIMHNARLK